MTGVPGVLRLCQCEVWVQGKLRRHMYVVVFSVVLTCTCVCACHWVSWAQCLYSPNVSVLGNHV